MSSPPLELLKALQEIFLKRGENLSVAESCTGGLVSYWLSHLPGASNYFKGSVISYDTEVKSNLLGLDPEFIKKEGVVNEKSSKFMAQGVRDLLKTNWSLSVTGIAGPAIGVLGEPVGQVAFAVSSLFATKSCLKHLEGKNREEIQHQAALFSLDFLLSELKYQKEE